jgi:septal ring factor EnvC (AmiA/AmiB activator)
MSTDPLEPVCDSANSELGTIADAIEELQVRLAQTNEELAQAALENMNEHEVVRIIEDAQRFSDACLSKLEMRIRGVLFQAEVKAAEILREADEEAAEILRQARRASFMPESTAIPERTADELQAAIVGFAAVNRELVTRLTALNDVLTPIPRSESTAASDPVNNVVNR